jgi:hypothetical protein
LTFTLDTTLLSAGVADSVESLTPLFRLAVALVVGGAVLSWGLGHIQRWRRGY